MKDSIVVRFLHGSVPRHHYKGEPRDIGGKFGGHVAIQIDGHVYGFYYRDRSRIHIFPNTENKNCEFQQQTLDEWEAIAKDKKETRVFIPVTQAEKQYLLDFYHPNLEAPSYDYSFFGQRCASSCYANLKAIGKMRKGHYFFNAFYPGQFRKRLLREAERQGFEVLVKEGSERRIWEGS